MDAPYTEENIRLLNNCILLLKCQKDHARDEKGNVLVILTDKSLDYTNWMEIRKVGPKCKYIKDSDVGKMIRLPDFHHDLMNMKDMLGPGYWMCHEEDRTRKFVMEPFVLDENGVIGK